MAITTLNAAKELAAAYRPVVLCEFTFPDASTLFVSTHNADAANGGYAYNGNSYLPMVDEQAIDRLAQLSELGIDRVPSVTIKLADPAGTTLSAYERGAGKGFRGATVLMRLVGYDPETGNYTSDFMIPFPGRCDQPGHDGKDLVITAQSLLNLGRYMLPSTPIQQTCPWINPDTLAQRAEASDTNSQFYPCGETRDLTTAPPCQYTNDTCTQLSHRGNVTFNVKVGDQGVNYLSGKKLEWTNADTSAKYREFWPLWLGGMAWLDACVLNQQGDGNFTRGEIAVGFGPVDVPISATGTYVVVNGEQLTYNSGDYSWVYSNAGQRAGTPCGDAGYNGLGDPYGNLTVIEVRVPRDVWDPASLPSVQVLARPPVGSNPATIPIISAAASGGVITVQFGRVMMGSDPGDQQYVTITGCGLAAANGSWQLAFTEEPYDHAQLQGSSATGSGTGGTCSYLTNGFITNSGAIPTPLLMLAVLGQCGIGASQIDLLSVTVASKLCLANGFCSAMVLRNRRSAADVMRGLRQSIGAMLTTSVDGKIGIQMEGPLAEQQPGPVDGSNYNSAIVSQLRDGTPANGYAAYQFTASNSTDLQRVAQKAESQPNTVSFPFQDPLNNYTVSTYTGIDSDDVARMGQQIPGSLQVQPEGISGYGFAAACANLGLKKMLRGNASGEPRGTEWWSWKSSFRGCRLKIGDLVLLNFSDFGLSNQLIRITEIAPSRNYETVTFKGHFHSCVWYLSAGAVPTPDLGDTISNVDLSGERTVTASGPQLLRDQCVSFDTSGIAGTTTTLSAGMDAATDTAAVVSGAPVVNGTYLLIDSEIMYVEGGAGTASITVDRGALGTTAASHSSAATVHVPGILAFTLLSIANAPARDLIVRKITGDLGAVVIHAATGNTFPGGGTTLILADNLSRGTALLHFPDAASTVLAVIAGAGPSGASGASVAQGVLFDDMALTADTLIVSPQTPTENEVLIVYIEQGGGWKITWASTFKGAPLSIDQTAGAVAVFEFIGHAGYWWYTNTGDVPWPTLPSSITMTEVGTRVLIAPLNRTQATIHVAWTDPGNGPAAVGAYYRLNVPAGVEGGAGNVPVQISGSTRYVEFPAWAPTSNQSWSITLNLISASGASSAAITSAPVTVYAIGSAASTTVTGGTVGTVVTMGPTADGIYNWGVQVGMTVGTSDPNCWIVKLTIEWGKYVGGTWTRNADQPAIPVEVLETDKPGAFSTFIGGNGWQYPADASNIARLQWWSVSRSDDLTGARVLQANAFGTGVDHYDITFTIPGGALDASRIKQASVSGLIVTDTLQPASLGQNVCPNASFDNVADGVPLLWSFHSSGSDPTPVLSSDAYNGPWSLRMDPSTIGINYAVCDAFRVTPGQQFAFSVWLKAVGANSRVYCGMDYYDASGNTISETDFGYAPASYSAWTQTPTAICTIPAGACYADVYVLAGAWSAGYWECDSVSVKEVVPGTQLQLGTALGVDTGGSLQVKIGAALGLDGSGNLKVKLGSNLGVDGSGNAVVPNGVLGQAVFVSGALADPNGAAWSSAGTPVLIYYGIPNSALYQTGQLLYDIDPSNKKIWRNAGPPTGWIVSSDPADIIAGTLAAGVVYAGAIACSQLSAGTMTVLGEGAGITVEYSPTSTFASILPSCLASQGLAATGGSNTCSASVQTGTPLTGRPHFPGKKTGQVVVSYNDTPLILLDGDDPGLYLWNDSLSTPALQKVIGPRVGGPPFPSGWADSTAQSWANSLLTTLRAVGIID